MAGQKRTRGMGIQNWLTLLLLLIFLPLLALQGYRYYNYYQEKQEEALQANLEIARAVAKSFDSFVQDVLRQELAIGLAITSSKKMTPGDIIRLIETSRDYPAVRDFNWLSPEGRIVYSSNSTMVGADASDRSYFREVVNGRDWAVSELIIGKVSRKPTIAISRGIRDGKGNLLGIVFAAILPEKLDAQLAIERSKGGAISIVDRQGMLVYRYPTIDTTWEDRNWLKIYPEYEDVFKGREISKTFFATYEGKERLASIVPISSIGWAAGAGKRKEDVTGPIIQSLARDAIMFLSVSLIAFLVAVALSRKITNPIAVLRNYASSLGEGEEPKKIDVEYVPELQDLAKSFETMAEKVRSRETDLRASESRLRTAHERSGWLARFPEENPNPVIRVSSDGRALYCNPASIATSGWKCEIGKLIPDPLLPYVRKAFEEEMQVGKAVELENKTFAVTVVPFSKENYANVYGRDITERILAEEELKKLAAVVRHSSEFVNIANLDGMMIFLNKTGAKMVGLSADQVARTHILQVVPDHLHKKITNEILPTLEGGGLWSGELQYINLKTGGVTDVYATTFTIKDPEKGTPLFLANTSIDITQRKKLEEETRRLFAAVLEEKDRLTALINSMSDEVWFADTSKNFTLANPQAVKEFKLDGSSIEVENLAASLEVYRPDGTPRPVEEAPPLRALNGEIVRYQEEVIRIPASNELRHREVNSAPVRDAGGNIIGSLSVVRDITDRKLAEIRMKTDLDALMRMHALSGRLLGVEGSQSMLQEVMDSAVAIMGAERGTLQLIEGDTLRIVAHHGHKPPFLEFFASAETQASVCGEALLSRERVIVPDVEDSPIFAGTLSLPVLREADVRAIQSTPLVSRTGVMLGLLTTQWRTPHTPPKHDLWRIDLLARQASDLIELVRTTEDLELSKVQLEEKVRERTLELQNLAEQLERSRDHLRVLASELVLAEERERKRIAAVLHDDIAQTLAVARMRVDMLHTMAVDEKSRQTLKEAKEFLLQCIRETRALMNDVGNPLLFDLGIAAACESLATRLMERHPIDIRCDIQDSFRNLDPEVKVILFQAVREMLNNVIKHSKAQHAEVHIHRENDRIRAMVQDDGLGFDTQKIGTPTADGGFGLFSIRERLMSFNGNLQIESVPGTGTIVTATLPTRLKIEPSKEITAS